MVNVIVEDCVAGTFIHADSGFVIGRYCTTYASEPGAPTHVNVALVAVIFVVCKPVGARQVVVQPVVVKSMVVE